MPGLRYFSDGKWQTINAQPASAMMMTMMAAGARRGRAGGARAAPAAAVRRSLAATAPQALHHVSPRLASRFHAIQESSVRLQVSKSGNFGIIPTETVVLGDPGKAAIAFARGTFGFEIVEEGLFGKVLLRAPGDGQDRIERAFALAAALHQRGGVKAAHPNFFRVIRHAKPGAAASAGGQWNLDNDGSRGVAGADVHALAAWAITRGEAAIRVAVLDEGVDSAHPFLAPAIVAERDFVDGNPTARPDGDDAHGTCCAGIVAGRDPATSGLAPGVSLVGVRIAKGDGHDNWIFDDFETADAIDWSWDQARADVLSNSWGGGPPVDVISRAFLRARTRGRGGKGCVIAVAAGNEQAPVSYPATLNGVLAVGASNEWDKRKTTTSQDGEDWWGSNYGNSLDLVAPGVHIRTTDIHGARGYATTSVTDTFNGTSSATPHVAAAAALVLSLKPALTEQKVREILTGTCDKLKAKGGWNRFEGNGRLNAYAALRRARLK